MSYINKYLRNFKVYKLASHKVWTVPPEDRQKILKLDWNEATIPPSPNVQKRLEKLIKGESFFHLYPSTYNEELLALLSEYTHMPVENLQYFASSDSLHEYIAKLYISVGDPVLLLGPTYDNFRLTAEVCGADLYFYMLGEDFSFDPVQFEKRIDEIEPSLVYICNPNNPTGTLHEISYIHHLLEKYPQVLFLIDEAYAEFSGVYAQDLCLNHENILISRTMSKAFALANFRFGYLIASPQNINYISSIRNPKNITTFAQEAVMGALQDIPYMEAYVQEVNLAAAYFSEKMKKYDEYVKCIHKSGNFVLLRFYHAVDKVAFIEYLVKHDIYVRDVSQTDFLRDYCIRVTIGTRKQMQRVIEVVDMYFMERKNEAICNN